MKNTSLERGISAYEAEKQRPENLTINLTMLIWCKCSFPIGKLIIKV
jgi:hypothetical protein